MLEASVYRQCCHGLGGLPRSVLEGCRGLSIGPLNFSVEQIAESAAGTGKVEVQLITNIIAIRHAHSDWTPDEYRPLSPSGRAKAAEVVTALKGLNRWRRNAVLKFVYVTTCESDC